jgi:hypothetical protein
MSTDRIIWGDGHVSTIPSEEASRLMYVYPTDKGWEWRMKVYCVEFVWKANCWMQVTK